MNCPSCGALFYMGRCSYCGRLSDSLSDRTASELAIQRLRGEIAALQAPPNIPTKQIKSGGWLVAAVSINIVLFIILKSAELFGFGVLVCMVLLLLTQSEQTQLRKEYEEAVKQEVLRRQALIAEKLEELQHHESVVRGS